jgi:hypothetical protein
MTVDLSLITPDTKEKCLALLELGAEKGYSLYVLSGLRSCAEQNAIYAQGRTKPGPIVTQARGCVSWHVLGRAFDVGFHNIKAALSDYRAVGELGKSLGLIWGGDFKGFFDGPHFEWHPGVRIQDFCPNPDDCKAAVAKSFAWRPKPLERRNPMVVLEPYTNPKLASMVAEALSNNSSFPCQARVIPVSESVDLELDQDLFVVRAEFEWDRRSLPQPVEQAIQRAESAFLKLIVADLGTVGRKSILDRFKRKVTGYMIEQNESGAWK